MTDPSATATSPGARHRALRLTLAMAAQFALTALGVFLGLQADQWRDDRQRAQSTQATLANFRRELAANRVDVARRLPYHSAVATRVHPLVGAVVGRHQPLTLAELLRTSGFDGTKSVEFRTTAWELALATQSLGYLDQSLAFDLAAVYRRQQGLERFSEQYLQSLLTTNILAARDVGPSVLAMDNYFREATREEERLIAQYDSLLPRLDRSLRR